MKKVVREIEHLGKKYKYKPAIVVPALVLKRYHNFLSHLSKKNLEFAIHGYTHKNFKPLNLSEQVFQIQKAKNVFVEFDVPFYGFRAPYLSWNNDTVEAVQKSNLLWESDEAFIWNGFIDSGKVKLRHFQEHAIRLLYNPIDARSNILIPRQHGEVISIPIALPDDEILIDRLGIKNSNEIAKIWTEILVNTHRRGDIFVLQLHPERFPICREAMEGLLDKAIKLQQSIWITGMREVAEWWKEKSQFNFTFQSESEKGYRIQSQCTDHATVLGRNISSQNSRAPFYQDYHIIKEKEFFIESCSLKPCIGVHPRCSKVLLKFLRDEGFPYEVSDSNSEYFLFLKEYKTFARKDEMELLKKIEENPNPIVRYWRWPDNNRSAFVTTHDLDCLTLTDFLLRVLEK